MKIVERELLIVTLLVSALAGCTDGSGGLDPNQFGSCAALQENEQVQNALATLAAAGEGFTFFSGSLPPNLTGLYKITASTVTYTQSGPANTVLAAGRASFTHDLSDDTVEWGATQGNDTAAQSLRGFVGGTSAGISVCLFAEAAVGDNVTGAYSCRSQNALFYSLTPSNNGQTLTGNFLNVTLAVLAGNCSSVGAFSLGTITLQKVDPDVPEIELLRTISTGSAAATGLVVSSDGTFGFATTAAGLLRFATSSGGATPVALPQPNSFTALSAPGLAGAGGAVGVVTGGENSLLSYSTGATPTLLARIVPPTSPSQGTLLNLAPLYEPGAQLGFVGVAFQLQRPGIGFFNPIAGAAPVGLSGVVSFTQTDLVNMTVNSTGTQVAGALRGAAPFGRARFVGLVDTVAGSLTEEVDISSQLQSDFRDDLLVYAGNGSRIFVTTDAAVVSIQTGGAFAVDSTDFRDSNSDTVQHIASSRDGAIAAVLIRAGPSNTNYAVLDAATLSIQHAAAEPNLRLSGEGGFAGFFGDTRILAVEDGAGRVAPAAAELPFRVGDPRQAFTGSPAAATAFAVGGRTLAVANPVERAIYIFRLVNP